MGLILPGTAQPAPLDHKSIMMDCAVEGESIVGATAKRVVSVAMS